MVVDEEQLEEIFMTMHQNSNEHAFRVGYPAFRESIFPKKTPVMNIISELNVKLASQKLTMQKLLETVGISQKSKQKSDDRQNKANSSLSLYKSYLERNKVGS